MIKTSIQQSHFPGNSPHVRDQLTRLNSVCDAFVKSGLADNKFEKELNSGCPLKLWAHCSEALVADRLGRGNITRRIPKGKGPDFLVINQGKKVYLEVTCPQSVGIPQSWSNAFDTEGDVPHDEILLRVTSAIKTKSTDLRKPKGGI
jgi:hypothetical protein